MEAFYPWFVFTHLIGAFGFALSHGVSAEMVRLLASSRGAELAVVGSTGLLVILWLMFFKPF